MKEKLEYLLREKQLTATSLARLLEIQPSGISHIMSGRNKPSFDLVVKILSAFPDINPDWLLQGVGSMYKDGFGGKEEIDRSLFGTEAINAEEDADESEYVEDKGLKNAEKVGKSTDSEAISPIAVSDRKVRQIIVYYDDNTFETFTPR